MLRLLYTYLFVLNKKTGFSSLRESTQYGLSQVNSKIHIT